MKIRELTLYCWECKRPVRQFEERRRRYVAHRCPPATEHGYRVGELDGYEKRPA